jgi:crotonobetainyl-CoA:carnitine CoA-transferase CaiB-like acyl-CoA transferase
MTDLTVGAATGRPGPLAGVRIIDLSVMISGPLATMLLADQGADVLKVESPGVGDLMRYVGSGKSGMSALFAMCNRGKRSVVLDLKHDGGKLALRRLFADADVIVQNFRPGAMERLGLGYEAVRALNPDVIFVSVTGFGSSGPHAGKRVYDNVIQGYSGFASVQGEAGEPALLRTLACDKVTAYTVAQAVTAALFARERGGGGQRIDVAMLDSTIAFLWPDAGMDIALLDDDVDRRPTIASGYDAVQMADGSVTTTALSDAEFRGLCRALHREDVADDPRFATITDRMAHLDALAAAGLDEAAARIAVDDFIRDCDEYGVPAAPLRALADVPDDPQVISNEVFTESTHPTLGRLRDVRPAARFGATPATFGRPAPRLGEHTDEVLEQLRSSADRRA